MIPGPSPLDGTPVRLFASLGSAIASFWTAERSRKAFGAGDYRAGWFLLDDDAVELNNPMGWEPLTQKIIAEKARDFGEQKRRPFIEREQNRGVVPTSCLRSMLAVVPGVSNFIQTRVGHSARSFRREIH